jgi:hypothetical protein
MVSTTSAMVGPPDQRVESPGSRPGRPTARIVSIATVVIVFGWTWWQVWSGGYQLYGDTAVVAVRAGDVFGPGSPLLGMPSAFNSWSPLADPAHPGPAVFWWLAPTQLLIGGVEGALVGTLGLTLLVSIWTVLAAERRLGPLGAPAAAVAVLALARLGTFTVWEPLNSTMAVLVAFAAFIATWSVIDGEEWSLPVAFLAGSAAKQFELAFAPTVWALLLGATLVVLFRWRRESTADPVERRRRRSVVAWTVGVMVAMWLLPIGEAVVNGGGNLAEGLRAVSVPLQTRGLGGAWRSLSISLVPAVVLSPLVARSWRLDRPGRRALLMAAFLVAVGTAFGQSRLPGGESGSLVWFPVALSAVTCWFATAVTAVDAAVPASPAARRRLVLILLAWPLLAAVALHDLNHLSRQHPFGQELYPAVESLATLDDVTAGTYRLQPLSGPEGVAMALALVGSSQQPDVDFRVDEPLARYLGGHRLTDGTEDGAFYVTLGPADRPPAPGARLVERWQAPGYDAAQRAGIDRRVASAVREDEPVWSSSASEFFVASIVAGAGEVAAPTDYDTAFPLGSDLLDGRTDVRSLGDTALAELVAQRQLLLPPTDADLLATLDRNREHAAVNLWSAPDDR